MNTQPTIVLVLKSGGDFAFRDVQLIAKHINGKWKSSIRPRIICLWDKASEVYELGNIEIHPLNAPEGPHGAWSRIELYSPKMEQYKPFLYVDLDTAVIQSLENIFDLVHKNALGSKFITLEDFWQHGQLATGLVWFPANCEKTKQVYNNFSSPTGKRMDVYIRSICKQDLFWQQLTTAILDFKPRETGVLSILPVDAYLVCFHGKPRIYQAAEASLAISWVKSYVGQEFTPTDYEYEVTVIIPYKEDRGWLQEAIDSVPKTCQLLLGQGEGNWPANFNKMLPEAKGKYVKFLHEDDRLTPNGIGDSVKAIEEQGADFIHGNVYELSMRSGNMTEWVCKYPNPSLKDLLFKNTLHSASLMYRKEIFDKIGGFDETLNTAEEYEFNLRCLQSGLKLGFCPSFLSIYRRHPAQKVRTVPKLEKDKERQYVQQFYTNYNEIK